MGYQAGVGIGLGPDGLTNAQRTAQNTPQTATPIQPQTSTPSTVSTVTNDNPHGISIPLGSGQRSDGIWVDQNGNALAGQGVAMTNYTPATGGTTTTVGNGTSSAGSYEQALENALTPSADETKYTSQLDALNSQMAGVNASRDLGIQGVNEQPIATPFLTGESAAVTNRAATQVGALSAQATPLKDQLAQAQARRQSAIDVAKAGLGYQQDQQSAAQHLADQQFTASQNQLSRDATSDATKYSTATAGSEVYNTKTGEVVNGGTVAPKVATTPAGLASGGTYTSGSLKVTPDMYSQGKTTLLDTKATDAKGNPNRGTDGWSNPAIYLGLLHDFITNGGTQADFLKLYPVNTYINPKNTMSQIVALGGGTKPKVTTAKKTTSSGAQLP